MAFDLSEPGRRDLERYLALLQELAIPVGLTNLTPDRAREQVARSLLIATFVARVFQLTTS